MVIQKIAHYSLVMLMVLSSSAQAGFLTVANALEKFTRKNPTHIVWDAISDALTTHALESPLNADGEELIIDEDTAQQIAHETLNLYLDTRYAQSGEKNNGHDASSYTALFEPSNTQEKKPLTASILNAITLQTYKQLDGFSCGYHATFNAHAIQELFNASVPVTANAVIEKTKQQHHRIIKHDMLEQGEIVELIDMLDVKNIYFLQIKDGAVTPVGGYNTSYLFEELLIDLALINKPLCAHFICNTGGHWVLVSVVKLEDQKPQLFFQDSGPASAIPSDCAQYTFIQNIYNRVNGTHE